MLFIHQQIQSFLNLGACKEYPIMAKPKFPKKSNGTKESVSSTITPPPIADTSVEGVLATPVALSGAEAVEAGTTKTEARRTESRKTESRKTGRKPEIVKTEPRANLVPINLDDEIRRLAYLFSERRGFEAGHETEDWLNAEREVRQRYHQQSASASASAGA
jgi:hypothetical protein